MDNAEESAATEQPAEPHAENDLPPGGHPLEIAARKGIGPLAPAGREVWHGNTVPCVSCGQLAGRGRIACDYCGQDLSDEMIGKMRAHAGPWYVLEHVRPFPGVNLDRIIRQIRRGVLTETSIVRGPPTDFQWRFAVETPGLCRYFGRCWRCHAEVSPSDSSCPTCDAHLAMEQPHVKPTSSPQAPTPRAAQPPQLKELTAVLDTSELPTHDAIWDESPRIGRISATWIAAALLVLVILALMWITRMRAKETAPALPATPGSVFPSSQG